MRYLTLHEIARYQHDQALSVYIDSTYLLLSFPFCLNFKRPTAKGFSAQISYIPTGLFLIAFSIVSDILFAHDNFSLCFSVVKEEISDEEMNLPCFNGRVVAWVSKTRSNFPCDK